MRYLKVRWVHDIASEPVLLFGELDTSGKETRRADALERERGRHSLSAPIRRPL
ncbi:hypothetical protein GCM10011611_02260 [Aliidongia dinghuensis]|uniref:DUF6881 domain-containing protein n=1 Tax=Aliidongia dinghuensis TaxID=1867774 RepID=A0A8J3E2P2_9PROT|nr:hypothetical protein GCM10011611_02260 [Aliidongia dinghuensis]